MNKSWLLQCNLINQDQVEQVRSATLACGDTVASVRVESFTGNMEFMDGEPANGADVIPYGSNALIKNAIERQWKGVFTSPRFCVSAWQQHRSDMLNHQVFIATAGEAAALDWRDISPLGWFVRPNEDFKLFAGTVEPTGEALRLHMARIAEHYGAHHQVSISPAVTILAEWRWFIVAGRVVSGAMYMSMGSRCSRQELDPWFVRQAQQLADKWLPHETCVMDTAVLTENGDMRVLEFNNLNTSGFYGHDIAAVVQAISALPQHR